MICDGWFLSKLVKKESEEKGADRRTLPPMYGLSGAAAPSMSSFIYGSYWGARSSALHIHSAHALQPQQMANKLFNIQHTKLIQEKK